MNDNKIALAKKKFFEEYPLGFEDEKMLKIKKKHNIQKVHDFAVEAFNIDNFSFANQIMDNWVKIIN